MVELSERLLAVAEFAKGGVNIADIGTDHALVPVWLCENGAAGRVAASDIGEKPLKAAKATVGKYGFSDRVELIYADGLDGITSDFDTVIIAGMGGDAICDILSRAEWVFSNRRLVLQPQTRLERVTGLLYAHGCAPNAAKLVRENGKLYIVLAFDTQKADPITPTPRELYGIKPLLESGDPLLKDYLDWLLSRLKTSIDGIESGREPDEAKLLKLRETYSDIRKCLDDISC